ncbi:AAA family ATPase [uncultured Methanobrevibacter sp.]|uniref:AAA family ATPase n=1 Tax=uncultured Methanobrevibacter sp. TaxID=253161 RepID=UPI0025E7A67E|nr:AAA family ATPase [uncultured Methanobrevibacter sp.]
MPDEIEFNIYNFGPINEAKLKINKLNVVGGVNASGKSFSARLLFCIMTALSDEGKRIDNNGVKELFKAIIDKYDLSFSQISSDKLETINSILTSKLNSLMESWEDYDVSYEYFNEFYSKFVEILNEHDVELKDDLNDILRVIDLHSNKFQYVISVLRFILMMEFGAEQLITFANGNVEVLMDKKDCKMQYNLHFNSEGLSIDLNNENQVSCMEFGNVVYMDSISVMDFQLNGVHSHYHYASLFNSLNSPNLNYKPNVYDNIDELMSITKQFHGMLNGKFKFNPLSKIFSFESHGQSYDVLNIASGYKQIGVLQLLLSNHQLTSKTLLILDEPEINLHPSFQIQLARIIVQMVKKLGITVYINSHSPFIIEALEVYSKKECIEEFTNFYLCDDLDFNGERFDIIPIQRDDLKTVYDNLSNPFRIINNIRFENELNDLD